MEHCTWIPTNKILYEKIGDEYFPIVQESLVPQRNWCHDCESAVDSYRREYNNLRSRQRNHFLKAKHCYECDNCQPDVWRIVSEAPLCVPEKCEICFLQAPTCIEKDACPKNDIIGPKIEPITSTNDNE